MSNPFDTAEWGDSVHGYHKGKWVYQDYDGEQIKVWPAGHDGVWVETFGEGPVWVRHMDQHLVAEKFRKTLETNWELEHLPEGSVILVDGTPWLLTVQGGRQVWASPGGTLDQRYVGDSLLPATLLHQP